MLSLDEILRDLAAPAIYPQKYEPARARVLMIRMREADYRAASFLDDRMLSAATMGAWAPLDRVAEAAKLATANAPLHFIFHIGHVGSTLLSRLLDEIEGVLSLREPLPLRTLADAPDANALETFLRLWSRGFESTRAVVLKATSSTARIAPLLLAARPGAHALYMYLPAEPYLATLLAGENSPIDLKAHEAERRARLQSHLGEVPAVASLGELAAMSWLAERMTMEAVVREFGDRVLPLDFDTLLAKVDATLTLVSQHFGLGTTSERIAAAATSPALTRYSKAPEHAYSPAFRAEILAQSRRDSAAEIRRGLDWLSRIPGAEPLLTPAQYT